MATLAILRAGEPAPDEAMVNAPETDDVQHVAPEQAAIVATPPEPEKPALESDRITALTDVEAPAENPSSPEMPTTEAFTPDIPVQADAPSPAGETTVAAIAEITPIAPSRAAVTTPDQPTAPADASTRIAETKIATLGGPPVAIDKPSSAPPKRAPAKVRKSAQVKPAVKRRRIVQRPRVARPMAAQQPANPFGSPWAAVPQAR
ncbi:hypothetical protein [uncultured Bradyrhizobium sp.]|uniref:hypothetical protein n=1 Tax=uncultured Bradyrhizobium sp. TaxID=199684 RepID=UPI0035C9692F